MWPASFQVLALWLLVWLVSLRCEILVLCLALLWPVYFQVLVFDHWCDSSPLCLKVQFLVLQALVYAASLFPGSCFAATGVTCVLNAWKSSSCQALLCAACLLAGSCFVTTGVTCLLVTWYFSFLSCKRCRDLLSSIFLCSLTPTAACLDWFPSCQS